MNAVVPYNGPYGNGPVSGDRRGHARRGRLETPFVQTRWHVRAALVACVAPAMVHYWLVAVGEPGHGTGANPGPRRRILGIVVLELIALPKAGYTASLEWNWDMGETDVVVGPTASALMLLIQGEDSGDPFDHPFRCAP